MMLMNLLVGLPTMLVCLALQAALTFRAVRFYIRQVHNNPNPGRLGRGVGPLLVVMVLLMLGNFAQIMLWGLLFLGLGEFELLYEAVYHSGVNFTSLGYGDIVMSTHWKLLGPLEAANGVLMFAMTGAALMAVLQALIKSQLNDRMHRPG
ncbi:ion channel [Aeromonas bivalvium]|uniref:Ion channel n=1 Tax=Aeromonas bivalvium TaxID=440079 RepID=A0ABW9GPY7_9GAMM